MMVSAPSNLSYGKVVWQTVSDIVDGSDPDVTPDFIAPTGTVTFVASMVAGRDITSSPNPVTVVRDPITGILDSEGYLCTPDPDFPTEPGVRGVWLIATDDPDLNPADWVYNVTYAIRGANNRTIPLKAHQIYVPTYVTEADAVDLTVVGPVDNALTIGIPAAEAAAAAAIAAAAEAQASAAAAEAAMIDSAAFVGNEIATADTPAEVAVAAKIATDTAALVGLDGSALRIAIEDLIGGYLTESLALFARMSVRPDSDRRAAIDSLIVDLKGSGIWSKFEGFSIHAAHTSQAALLDWVNPTGDWTAINSPTFTADVGFTGDGTTSYLTTSIRSFTNYLPGNLMHASWVLAGSAGSDMWDLTGVYARLGARNASNNMIWRANQSATSSVAAAIPGMFSASRADSTSTKAYRNGSLMSTVTTAQATSTPTTGAMNALKQYGVANFSNHQIAMSAYGLSLTDAEQVLFYNAVADYMTAVGVLP